MTPRPDREPPFLDPDPLGDGPEMAEPDIPHVSDGMCWCRPAVAYEDLATGDRVYVHRKGIEV